MKQENFEIAESAVATEVGKAGLWVSQEEDISNMAESAFAGGTERFSPVGKL